MRVLDRKIEFDERSRNFRISAPAEPRKSKTWRNTLRLDQGELGGCVGYSWAGALAASPLKTPGIDDGRARYLYSRATELDAFDENYPPNDTGSSVLAGAKATREIHPFTYRWAFGLEDVLDALALIGPVVIGVNWYEGMLETKGSRHRIKVEGELLGGHATLLRGVSFEVKHVRIRNSWGASWGNNGDGMLSFDDLDRLLHEDGEACIPVHDEEG